MAGIILVVEVLGAVAMAVGAGMIFLPVGIMLAGFLARGYPLTRALQ
jgi:hypothetical protein